MLLKFPQKSHNFPPKHKHRFELKELFSKQSLVRAFNWHNGFLAILFYNLAEELLEEVIAAGISLFIIKATSTILLITCTTGIKLFIKRITKLIFYKEGHDKMDVIKKIFAWAIANKKSLIGTIVGAAGAGIGIGASWYIDSLPQILAGDFNIAPIIYTVVCLVCFVLVELGVCGRGFETVVAFLANKQMQAEKKEEVAIEKAAKKDLAKVEKAAKAEEKRIKAAALKQAAEEEKKKEAELFAKKVELMRAQLQAEKETK